MNYLVIKNTCYAEIVDAKLESDKKSTDESIFSVTLFALGSWNNKEFFEKFVKKKFLLFDCHI